MLVRRTTLADVLRRNTGKGVYFHDDVFRVPYAVKQQHEQGKAAGYKGGAAAGHGVGHGKGEGDWGKKSTPYVANYHESWCA